MTPAPVILTAPATPKAEPEATAEQPLAALEVPGILFEGDEPEAQLATGPGAKFETGASSGRAAAGETEGSLPEAYGTGRLFLAARDPRWLYTQWDFTARQQRAYNALSVDRHLVLRVHSTAYGSSGVQDLHVHPESRHWFVNVPQAQAQYTTEIGYYRQPQQWVSLAVSRPAITPPDSASKLQAVTFARVASHTQRGADAPPADLRDAPLVFVAEPERERVLAELTGWTPPPVEAPLNSLEGTAFAQGATSPPGGGAEYVSSPMGGGEGETPPTGSWLNVSAELVVYGATESAASVTIGGAPVELRPDGTFSYRVAFPDGQHTLTVSALSSGGELRQAQLHFSRQTACRGGVGAPPELVQPPAPEPGL